MKKFLSIMMLSSLLFVGCSCSKKEEPVAPDVDKSKFVDLISNEDLCGQKNVDGIILEHSTFQVDNGYTTIVTKITNNRAEDFFLINYQQTITNDNGEFIVITSDAGETILPGESKSYSTSIEIDLSSFTNTEYKINVENNEE